jgi:uncharacterized protein (DUF1800 family)
MTLSTRREFLTRGSAAALGATAGAALAGSLPPAELARWVARPRLAWAAGRTVPLPAPTAALHLLNRASWGPTVAELDRLRSMGVDNWIDEQLAPETVDDRATEQALAALTSLPLSPADLRANRGRVPVRNELIAATLYRAVRSRRQLYEVLVDHWSNVFSVFHPEELIQVTKTLDDRDVIRRHALGSFRDMVHASAQSISMMRYLNTTQNTKAGPNENYAREVMELHCLGVAAGGVPYSEQDVKQVARCFTGWGFNSETWQFQFNAANHDDGAKTVLGQAIRARGADEGHEVLDRLVDQPACALHVARRLVRRFVNDSPPEALVAQVAAAFGRDGDIRAMMGVLLRSAEFQRAHVAADNGPAKVRRPLEAWVYALRATGASVDGLLSVPAQNYEGDDGPGSVNYDGRVERYLQLMDQIPFRWRSPDGYPDLGPRWGGMHVMVSRWNYGLGLANGDYSNADWSALEDHRRAGAPNLPAGLVDHWAGRLVMRPLLPSDRQRLIDYVGGGSTAALGEDALEARLPVLVALLLDSPYAAWR